MLFRWWRHKQLDGDSGRKATNIRPLVAFLPEVDKNKRLYDFSIEISPGNSRRKSETWLGSRMSIGVGGCDDNSTGRLLGR